MTPLGVFDPAPLLRVAALNAYVTPGGHQFCDSRDPLYWLEPHPRPTVTALAETLGISRQSVHRYMNGQLIRRCDADRFAVRLGLHPCALWPNWFEGA